MSAPHKLRTPKPRAPRPPLWSYRIQVDYQTATRLGSVRVDVTAPADQFDAAVNKAVARVRLRNHSVVKITGGGLIGLPVPVNMKRN